jgi:hypothetical protein
MVSTTPDLAGGEVLDKLTKETFEPRLGDRFRLLDEGWGELDLELAAVEANGLRGHENREQFSLQFRCAEEKPPLPQRIYRLEHLELGRLDLFLVPISRDAKGTLYEAVFT